MLTVVGYRMMLYGSERGVEGWRCGPGGFVAISLKAAPEEYFCVPARISPTMSLLHLRIHIRTALVTWQVQSLLMWHPPAMLSLPFRAL